VVADIGPAPAREALAELLNGSKYNFIFVGDGAALERVILTLHDPGN
jgi:CheY-like chemotaxis protein